MTYAGGEIGAEKMLVEAYLKKVNTTVTYDKCVDDGQMLDAKEKSKEAHLACVFVMGLCQVRYGKLVKDIKNDQANDRDSWPKTVHKAYELVQTWMFDRRNHSGRRVNGPANDGISFGTVGERTKKDGDKDTQSAGGGKHGRRNIKCWKCGKPGHMAYECTESTDSNDNNKECKSTRVYKNDVTIDRKTYCEDDKVVGKFAASMLAADECVPMTEHECWLMHTGDGGKLPQDWLLLDTQSTTNVFSNPALVYTPSTTRIYSCSHLRLPIG